MTRLRSLSHVCEITKDARHTAGPGIAMVKHGLRHCEHCHAHKRHRNQPAVKPWHCSDCRLIQPHDQSALIVCGNGVDSGGV